MFPVNIVPLDIMLPTLSFATSHLLYAYVMIAKFHSTQLRSYIRKHYLSSVTLPPNSSCALSIPLKYLIPPL